MPGNGSGIFAAGSIECLSIPMSYESFLPGPAFQCHTGWRHGDQPGITNRSDRRAILAESRLIMSGAIRPDDVTDQRLPQE